MIKFSDLFSPLVKRHLVLLLEVLVILMITLFALCPFSCRVSAEGIKVIGGDYVPPVMESFTVENENTLCLSFSEKVNITGSIVSLVVDGELAVSGEHSDTEQLSPALEVAAGINSPKIFDSVLEYSEDGRSVKIKLLSDTEIGELYEIYGVVTDSIGNSLTFAVPFYGYNSRVPKVIMTEIQTVSISSQNSKEKLNDTYRTEFVEFLALSDGNLCGLELISGYDGENRKYIFPKIEVTAGEVFVVHLRNRGSGCISEVGEDLNEAFSGYTSAVVRDLWSESTVTALGNKTDVLIVKNQADGRVYDAVMYHDSAVSEWSKGMPELASLAVQYGIYDNESVENGTDVSGKSDTKTITRVNANAIKEMVLAGSEIQYPVKADSESWCVSPGTPGSL